MKVFLAGATGVIGRPLVSQLVENGHEVTAMTRSEERATQLRALGVSPVVCDVFDRDTLFSVVAAATPDAIVHQLTSIPEHIDPRNAAKDLAATNRLRTEGTRNLMNAAKAAGVRRFVAQSFAPYYTPGPSTPANEGESLYENPPQVMAETVQALQTTEDIVLNTEGVDGIALRYGHFYGPGTIYALDGSVTETVLKRRFPILGKGSGTFSFIHVADAASATFLALNNGKPGIYNVVDDDPAPVADWLPIYAELLNAPPPMRLPKFVGHLAAGRFAIFLMAEQRGVSNQKAKQELGWRPRYASWRDGFRVELSTIDKVNAA